MKQIDLKHYFCGDFDHAILVVILPLKLVFSLKVGSMTFSLQIGQLSTLVREKSSPRKFSFLQDCSLQFLVNSFYSGTNDTLRSSL